MYEKLSNKFSKIRKYLSKSRNTSLKNRGVFFLLFVIFIGAIAVNSGNNLVYLTFSTVLSFILISGFLSFSNLKGIDIEVDFPEFVFAKRQSIGILVLKNRTKSPKFRLIVFLLNKMIEVDMILNKHSESFTKVFEQRGIYKITSATIKSDFPFGFFERKKEIKINRNIYVFPEIKNITINKSSNMVGEIQKERKGQGNEFYSVREYKEGEDSRKINWKLSAKANKLMIIETRNETESLDIFLDTSSYLYETEEIFEDAVIKICSLVYKCFLERIPISFTLNSKYFGRSPNRNHYIKIFEALATAHIAETPPSKIPTNAITYKELKYV